MCLILTAYHQHPRWNLIVAANRDEFYQRKAQEATYWNDEPTLLAGRDISAGGTWMGVNRHGHFAGLTNVREGPPQSGARSRGELIPAFLCGQRPAQQPIDDAQAQYAGFNLLCDNGQTLWYHSNRSPSQQLSPGYFGLSNAGLNNDWQKVQLGRQGLQDVVEAGCDIEDFFALLKNSQTVAPDLLPSTGVDPEFERQLSAIFVETPNYGTRVSTIILRSEKELFFYERSFLPHSKQCRDVHYHLMLAGSD